MRTGSLYERIRLTFNIAGISGTAIFTLGFALLADCVGSERLAFAAGNAMIGISLGGIMGPVLGGLLYDHLGYYSVWICGLIFVWLACPLETGLG